MESLRHLASAGALDDEPLRPSRDVIEEAVDFSSCRIRHLDFRGVTFLSFVDFRCAQLRGVAWFDGAVFRAGVDFSLACFDHDARFDRVTFHQASLFVETEFRGVADFDGAQFEGPCRFDRARFFANAAFGNTSFRGAAGFRDAELQGGLWCRGAKFAVLDATGIKLSGRVFVGDATAEADRTGVLARFNAPGSYI